MYNFAFFIAGYGKPHPTTIDVLKKLNTKYPIYIVVGTDDPKLEEYKQVYKDNLIIFDKKDYINRVDDLGIYAKTHKICTYSRLVVDDYAKEHNIQFVGYLFDDILKLRLRYNDNGQIRSISDFDIDRIIDMYIELLNSSKDVVIVGPPNGAFYIGIGPEKLKSYVQRYSNFFIYDTTKGLVKDEDYIKSSIMEDMSLCIFNTVLGRMVICPGGLHVTCREAKATKDAYGDMDYAEYYTQYSVITNGRTVDFTRKNPCFINYKDFTPKIIEEKSRVENLKLNEEKFRDDFAVFILSHGRADNMLTLETLKKCGYTGKWYIICDNEDKTLNRYIDNFGQDHIVIFNKEAKSKSCDTMDRLEARNIVLFARNTCHEIARRLGLTYFLELDDDYTIFRSRDWDGEKLNTVYCKDLNSVINEVIDFLEVSNATTVAFSQTGDYIGGAGSMVFKKRLTRKAMNSFFCKVDRPFEFLGRINEDTNAYCLLGSQGKLFFTIADMSLNQQDTQQNSGGLTESYLSLGTYVKSFYTVMCVPSAVKVSEMGDGHRRMHHLVDWEHCVPKIISDRFKIKDE